MPVSVAICRSRGFHLDALIPLLQIDVLGKCVKSRIQLNSDSPYMPNGRWRFSLLSYFFVGFFNDVLLYPPLSYVAFLAELETFDSDF
jgi:hypothetical protein